ncbi:hypothetical protein Vadar_006599 [Vaccinium darrowii]|uniref:Uncharacterized protein n=1 Tax=Vaccinium darrowii TaxID=229202 RepID=A0ACB7YBZ8_9ERIC|nr:hypothetical protein Vadar_006599 [Vaccinium darrowii]
MTHIAAESNRRQQMNNHLTVLGSFMLSSYIQRPRRERRNQPGHHLYFNLLLLRHHYWDFGYIVTDNFTMRKLEVRIWKLGQRTTEGKSSWLEMTKHFTSLCMLEIPGWEDCDKCHLLKHQKQLDFRDRDSAEFDEGADKSL